jgi:hypothetical protein
MVDTLVGPKGELRLGRLLKRNDEKQRWENNWSNNQRTTGTNASLDFGKQQGIDQTTATTLTLLPLQTIHLVIETESDFGTSAIRKETQQRLNQGKNEVERMRRSQQHDDTWNDAPQIRSRYDKTPTVALDALSFVTII